MPSLILDKNKCLANIQKMATKAREHQLSFRPHCKTHQSAEIAEWIRDAGAEKITVSSFHMARYFALHGWKDILVAFPFNPMDYISLVELADMCNISILLDNPETLSILQKIRRPVDFYIDIDTGYGRTGIKSGDFQLVEKLIGESRKHAGLNFAGFYCHAGHSYKTTTQEERSEIHMVARRDLRKLKQQFSQYKPISLYGDTPNCSTMNDFEGIDEISPGNFVFYDLIQRSIGSCSTDEIAVAMSCTVAGKYPESKKLLVHGGAVHFSKEFLEINGKTAFGEMAESVGTGWKKASHPSCLNSISQEHGILENCGEFFDGTKIGDSVFILPPHSCLTANQMREYHTLEGEIISTINS